MSSFMLDSCWRLVLTFNRLPAVPPIVKQLTVSLTDLKCSRNEDSLLLERALARVKTENLPSTSKKRNVPVGKAVPAAAQPPAKKSKKEISCTICVDTHFSYLNDLNE